MSPKPLEEPVIDLASMLDVVIRGDGRCEDQQIINVYSNGKEADIRSISIAHLPQERGL